MRTFDQPNPPSPERNCGASNAGFFKGTSGPKLAYDKRTMESIRKRVKVITWLLIGALLVGTGAGMLSGVI
ncbi:hypothetical protein GCM10009715_02890 [Paeniglutamicibacter psychrophenolicus]